MQTTPRSRGVPIKTVSTEIINRLLQDFGGTVTADDKYWQKGRCPACGKKSLWTLVSKPLLPRCNHESKCGHEFSTRDQYPEYFEDISQRFEATPAQPNATADAYISMIRGFDTSSIKGWYQQDKWWKASANKGTATVRFWLDKAKTVGWQKFVDVVTDIDKDGDPVKRDSSFIGNFTGMAWTPPHLLVEVGTVW